MNILDILRGIEKLAVELLLWIIYIPKTIYKIIKYSNWVPEYVDEELQKTDKFSNYMSPILLYLGTTVILFVLSDVLGSEKEKDLLKEIQGLEGFLFLILPLLFALIIELFRRSKFNREAILRSLYIQCYYFSPVMLALFALILSDQFYWSDFEVEDRGSIEISDLPIVLFLLTLVWFLIVEIKFIARDLGYKTWKAIGITSICFTIIFAGFVYYIIMIDTTMDKLMEGETETLTLKLPETGTYTINIRKSGDDPLYFYSIGLTHENDTMGNRSNEDYRIREQINPQSKSNSPIFLTYGQVYIGQHSNGAPQRPHVFRGLKDEMVMLYLTKPAEELINTVSTGLNIYGYPRVQDLKSNFSPNKEEVALVSINEEDFLTYTYLDTLDNKIHEEKLAEFALPRSGQFSFKLDFGSYEGDFMYNLNIERLVSYGDNESFDTEIYLPGNGIIGYNEKYEGYFEFNEWVFKGSKGDIIELEVSPLDDETNISFDVLNANMESVIPIDNTYITAPTRWLYVFLFGYAVFLGFLSFFRKSKEVID